MFKADGYKITNQIDMKKTRIKVIQLINWFGTFLRIATPKHLKKPI